MAAPVALAMYAALQLGQMALEAIKLQQGVTDEELKKAWDEMGGDLRAAIALWTRTKGSEEGVG